jgi:predicted DNA-binding transcriptional regulator AlpA
METQEMSDSLVDKIDMLRDRLITEAEACTLYGYSHDTLRRRDARGEGPPRIKVSPRRVGYRLRDVLDDSKQREMAPNILSAG